MILKDAQAFENLLNYLLETNNFDFTGYKYSSLMRRIRQRMEVVAIANYSDYIHYLKQHPQETENLLKSIPVNYTAFFRDPYVWNYIASQIIPRLISHKSPNQGIKVWSAGCASGEEVYTLAMLFLEALGVEQFSQRVRIYGTDIHQKSIGHARQGIYSVNRIKGVPTVLLARYFEQFNQNYIFDKYLRTPIIFTRHNVLQDPPFSKVDLLVCRNTFIYFNPNGQNRALANFHFALKYGGFLVLGNTEMIIPSIKSNLFTLVDQKCSIYKPRLLNNKNAVHPCLFRDRDERQLSSLTNQLSFFKYLLAS
ncbi:MAG TPA: protein-glutamate O-methyltransferase CheR [Oculatellaceae cyanobacterium]|jgi:two-component system CheB/CheR fusion protein